VSAFLEEMVRSTDPVTGIEVYKKFKNNIMEELLYIKTIF